MNSSYFSSGRVAEPLRFVDHTYHDYSRYLEQGGELIKHKKSTDNFPARLHRILSNDEHSDVICWMPHGRAWKVLDRQRFIEEVVPKYFVCKRFQSFTRQLNGWGFKRLHQEKDFGCYYHECFLRGIPEITCLVRRLPTGLGKCLPSKESEPDFYSMSLYFPLPKKEPANLGVAKPEPRVGEEGQPARMNEITKILRGPDPLPPPPLLRPQPPASGAEVLTHPREISSIASRKTRKTSILERARAEADNAFTQGYVPDYHVLVNSVPKVERTAAQIQAQTSAAVSQGHKVKVRSTSLASSPQPVINPTPGDACITFSRGYVPEYHVLANSMQVGMSSAVNQEQEFALRSAVLTQPVSLIPGNLLVDIHGTVVGFAGYDNLRDAPLSESQMPEMTCASSSSYVESSRQMAHPDAAASFSRGSKCEVPETERSSTDRSIPFHVKMYEKLYRKIEPVHQG